MLRFHTVLFRRAVCRSVDEYRTAAVKDICSDGRYALGNTDLRQAADVRAPLWDQHNAHRRALKGAFLAPTDLTGQRKVGHPEGGYPHQLQCAFLRYHGNISLFITGKAVFEAGDAFCDDFRTICRIAFAGDSDPEAFLQHAGDLKRGAACQIQVSPVFPETTGAPDNVSVPSEQKMPPPCDAWFPVIVPP